MVDKHGVLWDKEKLRLEDITKWKPVTDHGVPVHVGEWGCNNKTPHEVCLAWMADELSLWKEAGWGWSMWNLRGKLSDRRQRPRGRKLRGLPGPQASTGRCSS